MRPRFGGVEPINEVPLLALPRHLGLERGQILVGDRELGDAIAPEFERDAGPLLELGGEGVDEFPPREAEFEEGVVVATVGLGREHPGRCSPRLAVIGAAVEHQHLAAAGGDLPGAGGPDRTTTYDDNFNGWRHLDLTKLFGTWTRIGLHPPS